MIESLLSEAASVALDGSGNGTLKMIPLAGRETWYPSVISVKTRETVVTSEAQCRIYIGPNTTDQYFLDGTQSGSTGDSTDRAAGKQIDTHGNYLWAVWAGGDAGAQAVMVVHGTRQVP